MACAFNHVLVMPALRILWCFLQVKGVLGGYGQFHQLVKSDPTLEQAANHQNMSW